MPSCLAVPVAQRCSTACVCYTILSGLRLTQMIFQSKACQRADWPNHKSQCQSNRVTREGFTSDIDATVKPLSKFSSLHLPIIYACALRALDLRRHPENAANLLFIISVTPRRNQSGRIDTRLQARRPELAFVFLHAELVPLTAYPPDYAEALRALRIEAHEENKRHEPCDGTFIIVVHDIDSNIGNRMPMGYTNEQTHPSPLFYAPILEKHLNEGMVFGDD